MQVKSIAIAVAAALGVSGAAWAAGDAQHRSQRSQDTMSQSDPSRGTGASQAQDSSVRDAQQALQRKGFDVGPVDGIMGPKTSAALREFQQSQGLPASGQLDGPTLVALEVGSSGMSSSSGGSSGTMSPIPSPSSTQSGTTQSDSATPHSADPSRQSSGGSAQTGG